MLVNSRFGGVDLLLALALLIVLVV